MKLWIFGDSFSIPSEFKHECLWNYTENWIDQVAADLEIKNGISNFSQFGCSNDYIFKNLIEQSNNFNKNDYVIIQLTSGSRKWFFEDEPALSNLNKLNPLAFKKEQYTAIKYYINNLQNQNLDDIQYTAYVYALLYLMSAKPNVNFVVLPGFTDFPGVNGNLYDDVCEKEFEDSSVRDVFYKKTGYDPRLNHMTHENHKVLAEKIVNKFKNNEMIDLTTGFETKIYNKYNI